MNSFFIYDKTSYNEHQPHFGGKILLHNISNQVITLLRKYDAKTVAKRGRLCHRLMMMICAREVESTWVI